MHICRAHPCVYVTCPCLTLSLLYEKIKLEREPFLCRASLLQGRSETHFISPLQSLSRETMLEASNGRKVPAMEIFSHALRYFRDHALRELSDQAGVAVLEEDVRWVITVPAIWSHPAKQFMRNAAYQVHKSSP